MNYWIWFFADNSALHHVVEHEAMLFRSHASDRIQEMKRGDRDFVDVTSDRHTFFEISEFQPPIFETWEIIVTP